MERIVGADLFRHVAESGAVSELRVVGQRSVNAAVKAEMSLAFKTVEHAESGEKDEHKAEGSQDGHRQVKTVVRWLQRRWTL